MVNKVPVFKKGRKEDPTNYRPVSLISVLGKVMEKVILGAIEKHVEDSTVISHSQHGFVRGKSCLSNLISFYDRVSHWGGLTWSPGGRSGHHNTGETLNY